MERIRKIHNQVSSSELKEEPVRLSYHGKHNEIGVVSMEYFSNMNALNEHMRKGLADALRVLERNPQVKVICLRSNLPKVFCAGANIKDLVGLTHESLVNHDIFKDLFLAFNSLRKPIIAAINRLALGGGLEIAMLCDIIICSEDSMLGLPEIKLGVMPGIGGTLIAKTIGKSNAMKMILTGQTITAKQALEYGLVSEVHKAEDLHKKQIELAESVAKHSLYSLATAKTAVKFSYENPQPQAIEFERRTFDALLNLPGAREGLPAFVQKKPADFTNK